MKTYFYIYNLELFLMRPQIKTAKHTILPYYFKRTALAILLSSSLQVLAAEVQLDIPAQPLDKALNTLAKQSGERIIFSTDITEKISAPAVKGVLSARQALEKLLAGSGLVLQETGNKGFTVIKTPVREVELEIETLSEVVVTVKGEKMERRLEDTLSSVVVATRRDIKENGDRTLEDVMMRTPGVYMQSGSENWGIRGVPVSGFDDQGPVTVNGAVAVYVDGALQPHRMVTMNPLPLWDIDQVEVFRGSQSTVQGRNALAGAVVMQTRDPSYKPELSAQINAGNYGQHGVSFLAGGALVEGTVAGRLALDYQDTDGYIDNVTLNKDAFSQRNVNARGKLLFQPNDDVDVLLTLAHAKHTRGENAVSAINGKPEYYDIAYDTDAHSSVNQNTVGVKLNYRFNDHWTLISETTGLSSDYDSLLDFDQTATRNREVLRDHKQKMLSQEFRVGYAAETFRGHVGLYFNRFDLKTHDLLNFGTTTVLEAKGDTEINNQALFGEVNWDFAERWQLIAGMRYDREKNDTEIRYPIDGLGLASAPSSDQSHSYNAFLPKLGVSYRLAPEHLVGLVAQRGYRAGGVHLRVAALHESYDPEFTETYEFSYRGGWLNNRLRTRANLYFTDWKDQQVRILDNTGFIRITNAAKSEMRGLELSNEYDVTDALTLFAGGTYNQTEYKSFESDAGDLSGKAFLYAPKYKYSLGATYRHSAGFTTNVNVTRQAGSPSAYITNGSGQVIDTRRSDDVTLVNLTLGYKINKMYSVNAYVKNLFDEKYITNNQGDDLLDVGAPRIFGVAMRVDM
jgi:outer membrane receptor protein involved in Fe transport